MQFAPLGARARFGIASVISLLAACKCTCTQSFLQMNECKKMESLKVFSAVLSVSHAARAEARAQALVMVQHHSIGLFGNQQWQQHCLLACFMGGICEVEQGGRTIEHVRFQPT